MIPTKEDVSAAETAPLGTAVRFWHVAMIALVLSAFLTSDGANDYKKIEHAGFLLHGRVGLTVFTALCLYFLYGLIGPQGSRLSTWFPFTRERLQQTGRDVTVLTKFKLPEHNRRQGLAGLVQFFGLIVFSWLAATGSLMYFFMERGAKAHGLMSLVKEAHELGTVLIPVYLVLHIGAVLAHSLTGHQVWKDIFFLNKQ